MAVSGAQVQTHEGGASCRLIDGQRWHFQHGPIDLLVGADGPAPAVARALDTLWEQFTGILPQLVAELPCLRLPLSGTEQLKTRLTRRMFAACQPFLPEFITPMAAVAGAVADELITHFAAQPQIQRAYINNGGDIALYLNGNSQYRIGLFANIDQYSGAATPLDGDFLIDAALPVRGMASSGWRGRSFSMGIADSVTVLAGTAAGADAAATLIGNKVFVMHPAVHRAPANTLKDDTDLGDQLVVTGVDALPQAAINEALAAGARYAERLVTTGHIYGAVMVLQGQVRLAGLPHHHKGRLCQT